MDNDNVGLLVDVAIKRWWITLSNRIQNIKESGNTPVLIALSRKMPRLIEWLTQTYLKEHQDLPGKSILDGCELTTELSIPFRVSSCDTTKDVYVLIDDIIIHGTTLKSVATDLEILSHRLPRTRIRIHCYLSSIFLFQRPPVMPSCVSQEDIMALEPLDLITTKKVISQLASLIRSTNLPLDMEYPIFRCKKIGGSGANILKSIKDSFNKAGAICTYEGYWKNTVTFLIERDENQYAFDFAKVRSFQSDLGISFEVFAPYTLPDLLSTTNQGLFSNSSYLSLWNKIALPIRTFAESHSELFSEINGESLKRSICRSLVVWANYLLSLSFYVSRCQFFLPNSITGTFEICVDDLKLIIGSECSSSVKEEIVRIINTKVSDKSQVFTTCDENDWFAPEQFRSEYALLKATLASQSNCVQGVMDGIFKFQNFSNPSYDKPQYRHDRLFYGETFSSLIKSCAPYFKGKEAEYAINRWIDDQIDNGSVVPKYELYITDKGNYRWRRFFHAGLNATELCKPNE